MFPLPSSNEAFLGCHRPEILSVLGQHTPLILDLVKIVADYVVQGDVFASKDYERVFGVETEDVELGPEFYEFWYAPDALDPTKLNCDTHLLPILKPEHAPEHATDIIAPVHRHRFANDVQTENSIETLERLAVNPCEGYRASRFILNLDGFRLETKTSPSCFLVARKAVFARSFDTDKQMEYMNDLNARTGAGYEVLPSALDLATISIVHHAITGDRYLSDGTGMEDVWTESRCKDKIYGGRGFHSVTIGGHSNRASFRDIGIVGLFIDVFNVGSTSIGVAGLRIFLGHQPLNTQPFAQMSNAV